MLRLEQREDEIEPEELWSSRRVRLFQWNAIRIGDRVYASTGDSGNIYAVVDIKTGEFIQRQRGLTAANGLCADGKLILLDETGKLALARPVPAGIEITSSVQLEGSRFWTAPTLIGNRLFVRNRERIMAFEL